MSSKYTFKQKNARVAKLRFNKVKRAGTVNTPRSRAKKHTTKQMRVHVAATTGQHKHSVAKARARGSDMKARKISNTTQAKISKNVEYVAKSAEVAKNIKIIDSIVADDSFSEYVTKNIGKRTIDVIKQIAIPQEDEKIASTLSMKINDVRRILNMLNSYGVARYDINKDDNGWLSFKWYINDSKLQEFKESINMQKNTTYRLPDGCDDFFLCDSCFEKNKVVIPFDAAFESKFRCRDCGRPLRRINKEEAISILFNKQ